MKKLLLLCMVFCLSIVDGLAQNYDETNLEALTNEFIQKSGTSDALSLMTNIKSFYSSLSNGNKKKMLSFYVSKVSSLLESEKKDNALAVIHLYQNLADKNDEKLPALLFIKGNLYSERMDSIHLKETIAELNVEAIKQKPNVSDYVSILNGKLDNIRTYIPPYKKTNGIWVADGLVWDHGKKNRIEPSITQTHPDLVLKVFYDSNADTLSFTIQPSNLMSEITSNNMVNVSTLEYTAAAAKLTSMSTSQLIVPYASDSIYVLWSSEKLNKNSPEFASIFRGTVSATAAAVSAELAQNNKHSFSSQLLGGMATTVGEIGLNAVISALFTPTKNMFTLEGHLKMTNDYLMTGTLTYKYRSVAADGMVYEDKVLKSNVALARWLPESNVVFGSEAYFIKKFNKGHFWQPMMLYTKENISFSIDSIENRNTRFEYCEEKIGEKVKLLSGNSSVGVKALKAFNNDQYKWLQLYNDSILKNEGYKGTFAIDNNTLPYLGIEYSDIDARMQKKTKLSEGVYVSEVDEMSAAYVGGLKKGDIIVSVNDQIMKDKNDMDMLIYNMKLGDWLKMKVLRGKKQLELLVRVTWK